MLERLLTNFQNVFKIPELRTRILFTLAMLAVYRVGAHVPTPGINNEELAKFLLEKDDPRNEVVDLLRVESIDATVCRVALAKVAPLAAAPGPASTDDAASTTPSAASKPRGCGGCQAQHRAAGRKSGGGGRRMNRDLPCYPRQRERIR